MSQTERFKVTVQLHQPFSVQSEYLDVTKVHVVGKTEMILAIETTSTTTHFMLENVLWYEVVRTSD